MRRTMALIGARNLSDLDLSIIDLEGLFATMRRAASPETQSRLMAGHLVPRQATLAPLTV